MANLLNDVASYNLTYPSSVDQDRVSYQTQVSRESPLVEAYQKSLLAGTHKLVNQPWDVYQGQRVAGFTDPQMAAFQRAQQLTSGTTYQAPTGQYDEQGNPIMQTITGAASWEPWMQQAGEYAAGGVGYWGQMAPESMGLYGEGASLMRGVTPEALDMARSGLSAYTSTVPETLSAYGEAVGQWGDVSGDILKTGRGLESLVSPYTTQAQADLASARQQAGGLYDEFSGVQGDVKNIYGGIEDQFKTRSGQIEERGTAMQAKYDPYATKAEIATDRMSEIYSPAASEAMELYGEGTGLVRGATPEAMDTARSALTAYTSTVPETLSAYGKAVGQWGDVSEDVGSRARSLADIYDPYATKAETGLEEAKGYMTGATGRFERQQFDPSAGGIAAYMSPYTQAVKEQAYGDIEEQAQQQLNLIGAQAAEAGAFGGARHGIAEAEMRKAALEQKTNLGAQLDASNYQQALAAAMGEHGTQQAAAQQAYEAQRGGKQMAGQGIAGLAQAGLGIGAGLAGLTAEEAGLLSGLGTTGATVYGQYGQNIAGLGQTEAALRNNLAQQLYGIGSGAAGLYGQFGQGIAGLAQTGAGIAGQQAGMYSQLGTNQAGLLGEEAGILSGLGGQEANIAAIRAQGLLGTAQAGMGARQAAGGMYGQLAQGEQGIGMNAANVAATGSGLLSEAGKTGATVYGQYGQNIAGLGQTEAALRNNLAQQLYGIGSGTAGLYGQFGQGIGALGEAGAGVMQQGSAQMAGLGGLGQQYGTQDINTLLTAGGMQQNLAQSQLASQYQQFQEAQRSPYEQIGFFSDIMQGVPTSQATMTSTFQPQSSGVAKTLGAGITGLGVLGSGTSSSKPAWS